MVKKKTSYFKVLVLLIAPAVFFLSLAYLVMLFVFDVRSLNDILALKHLIAVSIALMLASLIIIKATGAAIKKVLAGWLENSAYWWMP